jgi:hypothetical protein
LNAFNICVFLLAPPGNRQSGEYTRARVPADYN